MRFANAVTLLAMSVVPAAAWAQSADCPRRGTPMPQRPPPMQQTLQPNAVIDAEEGHVAAILTMERALKPGPLPQNVAGIASDISRTPLATWTYEGYLPERVPHRVSRFYRSPEGSLLALGEWDYKPDIGDQQFPGMDNASVAGKQAGLFSLRAPSGCASTTISWKDDRKLYRIEIVGPLDIDRQRATVTQIAESIAR